jgi:hypothetical protein
MPRPGPPEYSSTAGQANSRGPGHPIRAKVEDSIHRPFEPKLVYPMFEGEIDRRNTTRFCGENLGLRDRFGPNAATPVIPTRGSGLNIECAV